MYTLDINTGESAMDLDANTLKYILEVAKQYEKHDVREPFKALVSRLTTILDKESLRLDVGQMARTLQGRYVIITGRYEGGYNATFADSPSIRITLKEEDIERGKVAS